MSAAAGNPAASNGASNGEGGDLLEQDEDGFFAMPSEDAEAV